MHIEHTWATRDDDSAREDMGMAVGQQQGQACSQGIPHHTAIDQVLAADDFCKSISSSFQAEGTCKEAADGQDVNA